MLSGEGRIIHCNGTDRELTSCPSSVPGSNPFFPCNHFNDVGLICQGVSALSLCGYSLRIIMQSVYNIFVIGIRVLHIHTYIHTHAHACAHTCTHAHTRAHARTHKLYRGCNRLANRLAQNEVYKSLMLPPMRCISMPWGYTYILLTVAASCYAITGYSVAMLSNHILAVKTAP